MNREPIELGRADLLLEEGRQKAQREQIPLMHASKGCHFRKTKKTWRRKKRINRNRRGKRIAMLQTQPKYLTVKEAADFLGIAAGTLRNWVCRSKYEADPVPYAKFSARCLRFPAVDLEAWAGRRKSGVGNVTGP